MAAALAITAAAAKARRLPPGETEHQRARSLQLGRLREAGLLRPLIPIVMFELGNCALTLLILRSTQLLQTGGRSLAAATSVAVLLYAANNLLGAVVVAYVGGHWIDRVGARWPFASGPRSSAAAYAIFALGPHAWPLLLLAFVLSGAGIGVAKTAESTLVAHVLPDLLR